MLLLLDSIIKCLHFKYNWVGRTHEILLTVTHVLTTQAIFIQASGSLFIFGQISTWLRDILEGTTYTDISSIFLKITATLYLIVCWNIHTESSLPVPRSLQTDNPMDWYVYKCPLRLSACLYWPRCLLLSQKCDLWTSSASCTGMLAALSWCPDILLQCSAIRVCILTTWNTSIRRLNRVSEDRFNLAITWSINAQLKQ